MGSPWNGSALDVSPCILHRSKSRSEAGLKAESFSAHSGRSLLGYRCSLTVCSIHSVTVNLVSVVGLESSRAIP